MTNRTPDEKSTSAYDSDKVTINRGVFNALLTGVVGLALGVALGLLIANRFAPPTSTTALDTEALINAAVATAVASVPTGPTPQPTLDPNARYNVTDGGNPSMGPADAPIVMIEFSDFRCAFFKRFNDTTRGPLLEQYAEQVRFVYRDFPILGPDSMLAAIAGECADDQGQFWPMHDLFFADPQNLTREAFLGYAETLDMDVAVFTTCLDTNPHQQEILTDYNDGVALGVGGTPTFFINGRLVTGAQPIAVFQGIIEEELARLNSEGAPASESTPAGESTG